jgi:hypothetical protein
MSAAFDLASARLEAIVHLGGVLTARGDARADGAKGDV